MNKGYDMQQRVRRKAISIIFLSLLNLCALCSGTSANETDILSRINIIPTPKNIVLQRKGVLLSSQNNSDAVIVIPSGDIVKMTEAAETINARIKSLGGKSLPVFKDEDFTDDDGNGKNVILLGNAEKNTVTGKYWIHQGRMLAASMPPEQGYVIESLMHRAPGGGSVFVLAGTDSQGTYYAASTFKELIQKKDENIIAVAASVRDWPDCKYRPVWGRNVRNSKDMKYWSLFKATGVFSGYHPLNLVEKKAPFNISQSAKGAVKNFAYGASIGFTNEALVNTDLADKRFPFTYSPKSYKEILEEWDGVVDQNHLYSWSHEKKLRIRFDAISRGLKAGKFSLVWLHTADTEPNSYWSKRSKSCKKKWGDDFAGWNDAQVWLIKIVTEEIRKHNPDIKIMFCLRPYTSNTIDEVDWRWEPVVKASLKNIPFDKNSYICVREDRPDRIQLWREKWQGVNQYYYIEVLPARPSPLFATLGRFLDSFMDGSKDDIIWPTTYRAYPDPVNVLMTLERRWNRNSNGPGLWPENRFDFIRDNVKPAVPIEENLLLKVCRAVYGYEAGSVLIDVYSHGLNPDLAANPMNYRDIYNIANIKTYFKPQLKAAEKAFAAVEKVLNEKIPLRAEGKKFFPLIYRIALTTLALTESQAAIFKSKELIEAGKDNEAAKLVRDAQNALNTRITQLNKTDKIFKSWPPAFPSMRDDGHRTWKELAIETPGVRGAHKDCSAGARLSKNSETIASLMKNKKLILAEAEMLKKSAEIAKLPLPVITAESRENKSNKPFPTELEWKKAKWTTGFVMNNRLLYSKVKTKVAVLYDERNMYFNFDCPLLGSAPPAVKSRESDKWSVDDEYVELMVSPDIKKGFFQLFVNSAGVIGDLIQVIPDAKGGLYRNQSSAEAQTEGFKAAHVKPQSDYAWNSKAKTKIVINEKSWNIQIAVPFQSFSFGPFKKNATAKGDVWKVNFCRSIPRTNIFPAEYSSLNRSDYAAYWTFINMKLK
jgi:hypothetical protein